MVATRRLDLPHTAAIAAVAVGTLSLLYAVFYLIVAPPAQRGSDVDALYRSYLADPAGLRLAALCLFGSGLLTTLVYAALHRLPGDLDVGWRRWALILGVVSGVATSAHGLADLIDGDKLAHLYASGDAATRAAVSVAHATTSAVDPRGLATFGLVGLVVFTFSWHLRTDTPKLALLGLVFGVDLVLLFLSSAVGIPILILITGGLASVVLGPVWWFGVAVRLRRAPAAADEITQPLPPGAP
jgi:hypothetical protein